MSALISPLRRTGWRALVLAWLVLLVVLPARAQDDAPVVERDAEALADRLLAPADEPFIAPIPELYAVGDELEFWVGKTTSDTPTRITATLVADTPNVYIWVEQGLRYSPDVMQDVAGAAHGIFNVMRSRATYATSSSLPGSAASVFDPNNVFALPDIDNDPHLYILYTSDLSEDRDALHNPNDSLPASRVPGGYSNQHEIIYLNTTPFPNVNLSDDLYVGMMMRGMYNYVADYTRPDQPLWLREALGWLMLYQLQQIPIEAGTVAAFLTAPTTSLSQPSSVTTRAQTTAGQLLFLSYLQQRYGIVIPLLTATGDGMQPLDSAFAAAGTTDPVTGDIVRAQDAFADFVMTNALNAVFGDRRFFHRNVQLERGMVAVPGATFEDAAQVEITDQTVSPFSTFYVRATTPDAAALTISFEGNETVARLPMPASADPNNVFYWSGGAPNRDHTLTRAFDLRDVDAATLTFDAWYDLAEAWNYGYVEVSTDGGLTWNVLEATNTSSGNRYGAAFGAGFTGMSNPLGARPFPVMGVQMGSNGMNIEGVAPGGAAEAAGIQSGDVIVGYDGAVWQTVPDILGLLGRYSPGDTLNLYIQRGTERIDVPVILGAHETRVIQPDPLWLPQEVDLTPYVGGEVLVRFEYVSLPNRPSKGFAVDNIAIPELEFSDSADGARGWTSAGWQQITNSIPQEFLVQVATSGTEERPPRVERVLNPGEGASGEWVIGLLPEEQVVIAVSSMNDETDQPATFSLRVTGANAVEG